VQLTIDGILQTLLVGAISSLSLLSAIFLFFGHVFRSGPIRHIFRFLMYEADAVGNDNSAPVGETFRIFISLLLIATLFGAGALSETFSDIITSKNVKFVFHGDPGIKFNTFIGVGKKTISGGLDDLELKRFVTDTMACQQVELDGRNSINSPCNDLQSRIMSFYYAAKNTAYSNEFHFNELNQLQRQIDFTRSVSHILIILSFELFIAFAVAFIAEGLALRQKSRGEDAFSNTPTHIKKLLTHWLNLSAIRCLLLSIGIFAFAWFVMGTWERSEEDFDRRVYGYMFTDAVLAPDSEKNSNKSLLAINKILQSTYKVFQLDDNSFFEPSSVGILKDNHHVIISNDKGGQYPFVIYKLEEGNLQLPKKLMVGAPANGFSGLNLDKIESLSVSSTKQGDIITASEAYSDTEQTVKKQIVQFNLKWHDPDTPQITDAHRLELATDPCSVLFSSMNNDDSCVIEGITGSDPYKELLLGVRYKVSGNRKTPTLSIIRLANNNGIWKPELLLDGTLPGKYRDYGLSDLVSLPDGRLLVLTSFEADGQSQDLPVTQVKGALWVLPNDIFKKKNLQDFRPTALFSHKPEGITELGDGDWLVVYDDDANRKSVKNAPASFAINKNQSVYSIVHLNTVTSYKY